ncbi:D-aminoacyl-tRNA deacylase [Niveibacterium microcysteis]|uniref:D-aminoacyl-tRNA deacylase n=1 Tax=Niveibacterium microcysteis TaxID=2811415 RepID=A0ABX7MDN7_9RHOO|nr:D-aminoacyl-tRNA deacylase [Niveibacterium microcysteis]QSI77852.1 D-tyrosyl-tRNA(Tyr) deacylase [Niveibacterium microcysteis]
MIALIQRVLHASVVVDGETVGEIGAGLLALVGVRPEDDEKSAARLIERILGYRVFSDEAGRMNRSLADTAGGLLLVPQFTLAADTRKGTRASFTSAAEPVRARSLFDHAVIVARASHSRVATGQFGAEMAVSLTNHGPVTFWLES